MAIVCLVEGTSSELTKIGCLIYSALAIFEILILDFSACLLSFDLGDEPIFFEANTANEEAGFLLLKNWDFLPLGDMKLPLGEVSLLLKLELRLSKSGCLWLLLLAEPA